MKFVPVLIVATIILSACARQETRLGEIGWVCLPSEAQARTFVQVEWNEMHRFLEATNTGTGSGYRLAMWLDRINRCDDGAMVLLEDTANALDPDERMALHDWLQQAAESWRASSTGISKK